MVNYAAIAVATTAKLASYGTFVPPSRSPAFAVWLYDLLMANSGCPLEPYEIISQLEQGTGYDEAELCEILSQDSDFFVDPEAEADKD